MPLTLFAASPFAYTINRTKNTHHDQANCSYLSNLTKFHGLDHEQGEIP